LAELFQTSRPNITMHIKNILASGELEENVVSKVFLHTTMSADGRKLLNNEKNEETMQRFANFCIYTV